MLFELEICDELRDIAFLFVWEFLEIVQHNPFWLCLSRSPNFPPLNESRLLLSLLINPRNTPLYHPFKEFIRLQLTCGSNALEHLELRVWLEGRGIQISGNLYMSYSQKCLKGVCRGLYRGVL